MIDGIEVKDLSIMKKNIVFLLISMIVILVSFSITVNCLIEYNYNSKIYRNVNKIPHKKVGLVLGTSKLFNGRPNLYYLARLDAVWELYGARKIDKIVASGSKTGPYYNESSDMRNDLIKMGVNQNDIIMDPGGFRTLDSIVRAKNVFLLDDIVIVSQRSHCQRALFIAGNKNLHAVGYEARDINHPGKFKLIVREYFARVKAGIDVWIIKKQPKVQK